MEMKKIYRYGIFGGSFDPFTIAHFEIVKQALKQNLVDEVIIAPSMVSWHRKVKTQLLLSADRVKLIDDVIKAAKLDDKVWVFDNDIKRNELLESNGITSAKSRLIDSRYFIDTLVDIELHLKKSRLECGKDEDFEVYPIIGSDSYANFKTWHNWEAILKLSNGLIVVTGRTGDGCPSTTDIANCDIPYTELKICNSYLGISASAIRKEFENKKMTFAAYKESLISKAVAGIGDFVLLKTPIFNVVSGPKEPNGLHPIKIDAPDWVTIIVKREGKFLVEKQRRYGTDSIVEEFPCGMVEKGEDPINAAVRELAEETGFMLKTMPDKIGCVSPNPAFMMNKMHYFFIDLDTAVYDKGDTKLDSHEDIETTWVDEQTFKDRIMSKTQSCSLRDLPPAMLLAAFCLLYKKF